MCVFFSLSLVPFVRCVYVEQICLCTTSAFFSSFASLVRQSKLADSAGVETVVETRFSHDFDFHLVRNRHGARGLRECVAFVETLQHIICGPNAESSACRR